MFGSTWGQNNQNPQNQGQQGTGLFGQPAQQPAQPQGGAFGNTGFGSAGFGQQQQQQQQQQPGQTTMFGQQPQAQPQQAGFGAFGGATNTASTFGQQPKPFGSTGFGATNTTTTPSFSFGSASNTTQPTANAFGGANTGGFGTQTQPQAGTFGQPSTSTFGSGTTGTGFGSTNTGGAFGATNTGGAFGATNNTAGGIFGAAKPATGGLFGSTAATTPTNAAGQGTASPAYIATQERDTAVGGSSTTLHYQSITAMPAYRNFSFEELRAQDYAAGRKNSTSTGFGQTSAFGATTATAAPSAGLFGQPAQQSQPQQTNLFGQPAQPAQTTSLFGQNTNTQTTGAFGQPAANPGTGLFGQAQTQPAQQSAGLFGQPANNTTPAATGVFGQPSTATTNAFGSNTGAASSFGGGLFGQKPATAGTFGATPAQPSTGFGTFGQNNQAQTGQTTGIFGQAQQAQQPQPASTGFGFGANNTANKPLFGQPAAPAQTTGLFGQPAQQNTGAGLFGQPAQNAAAQPAQTGGLFGGFGQNQQQNQAQPAQPSGGLFGQPAQAQPAATAGTGLFGGGGGLFGQNNQQQQQQPATSLFGKPAGTTGGLFGNTTTAAPTTGGLFGSTSMVNTQQPAAGGGLFGQANKSIFGSTPTINNPAQQTSIFGQSVQSAAQPSLSASIDQNPFGNNPLFANLPPGPHVFSVSQNQAKKPLISVSPRKSFYRPSTPQLTKLRGFATPPPSASVDASVNPFTRSSSVGPKLGQSLNASSLGQSPSLSASLSDNKALGGRSSVKKLVLDKDINASELPTSGSLFGAGVRSTPTKNKVVFHPDLVQRAVAGDGLFGSTISRAALPAPRASIDLGPSPSYSANAPAREESTVRDDTPAITAADGDYWMVPPLSELQGMSHDQLVSVPNFTVGRHGYGKITFLDPVDLTTVYAISDIPEKTVLFEEGACTVYPDESQKAARGEGLNVPSEISLERCWPKDKATRAPIKNPNDPVWQRQERKLRKMKDTEFISFEPEGGVWTFRVPHFTRYGLGSDEEDEDEGVPPASDEDEEQDEEESLGHQTEDSESESTPEPESERRLVLAAKSTTPEAPRTSNRLGPFASSIDLDPRRVQVMQASMFHNEPAPEVTRDRSTFLARDVLPETTDKVAAIPKPKAKPKPETVPEPLRKYERVSNDKSVTKSFAGAYMDAGLALGRSFRVSWGPNGELVHLGRICGAAEKDALPSSPSIVNVSKVSLLSNPEDVEVQRANKLLDYQIKNSDVDLDDQGVPIATPNDDIRFHQVADLFGPDDRSHESSVWRLGAALFDEINVRLAQSVAADVREQITAMRRRHALAKWLQLTVAPSVEFDLRELSNASGANRAFLMLTGNQVARATEAVMEANEMHLATLISQIGGDVEFRNDIESQLAKWKEQKIDAHIEVWVRKIYALLAGIVGSVEGSKSRDPAEKSSDIVVAESLDWKRVYGLHLWFGGFFNSPSVEALESYEAACSDSSLATAPPHPWYIERPASIDSEALRWSVLGESIPKDALFEIIKLAMDDTVPLDVALYPRAFGPSPIDYRISWHAYILLARVLQKRDVSDRTVLEEGNEEPQLSYSHKADVITSNYAFQLESLGLWWYSIFVLLHLQESDGRLIAIKALLARHVSELDEEKEEFLINQLCVPHDWIEEAKAVISQYTNQSYQAFEYFVAAGQAKPAYDMALRDLAPEAAIRNDFDLLTSLFTDKGFEGLDDWTFRGQLYLQYADCMAKLPELLLDVAIGEPDATQAAEMERLSRAVPQLLGLLPEMFPDKSNIRQQICLGNMISSLMQFLPALKHRGMTIRPQLQSAMVEESVRLEHIQAMAHERFMTAIETLG
ncbi:nucleoporin [Rhizoctonia solani 123E]|uniref:Nucleoporin n=1 Tax=Rhizoctonia solani 123E TaxID=1423351 RepID=A0A074S4H0_9AGAM|nr:nucleoporin [Rhizoctonia solani 123E]